MRPGALLKSLQQWQENMDVAMSIDFVVENGHQTLVMVTVDSPDDSSAEALLEVQANGAIRTIAMDSYLQYDAIFASSGISIASLGFDGAASGDPPDLPPSPQIPDHLSTADRVGFVAEYFVDKLSSRLVPGTAQGRKACGWATNYVVRVALGKGLGEAEDMKSTISMFAALQGGKGKAIPWEESNRGDVVISPTTGANVGHVGILLDAYTIGNNSSQAALWKSHKTKASWHDYYVAGKGLKKHAFRLL